jgi:hypothetical protein
VWLNRFAERAIIILGRRKLDSWLVPFELQERKDFRPEKRVRWLPQAELVPKIVGCGIFVVFMDPLRGSGRDDNDIRLALGLYPSLVGGRDEDWIVDVKEDATKLRAPQERKLE